MLDIHRPDPSTDTKTHFSHSLLPTYIDALHPPTKKKPFSTIAAQPHSHTLSLILPAELWDLVHAHIAPPPREHENESQHQHQHQHVYARAFLSLSDILEDEFLDAYVRHSTTTLLSRSTNPAFRLCNGVLRIDMDRPLYERAGLVGTAIEDGGKKHSKWRWRIEIDLTQSSMRKGKKGFERVVWAAKNVLRGSEECLFCSANPQFAGSLNEGTEVLTRHAPKMCMLEPKVEVVSGVVVPNLDVGSNGLSALYEQEDALALLEWLDLVNLGSERVREGDALDSLLSRYEVPAFGHGVETRSLVKVKYSGFITPEFVRDLFLQVWKSGFKAKREGKRRKNCVAQDEGARDGDVEMNENDAAEAWFSMSAQSFGGKNAWSLMQFGNRETLVWEVES
jgi:ribonuclease P/MRP protein subunit RPP40